MSSSAVRSRAFIALAAVFAASLAVGAGGASARRVDPPGRQDANHCFFFTGVDLNDLFGVPEQFRDFLCREAQRRRVLAPVCALDRGRRCGQRLPGRLRAVASAANRGLRREAHGEGCHGRRHTSAEDLRLLASRGCAHRHNPRTARPRRPQRPALAMAVTMPRMKPLSVGAHSYEVTWVLSAQHCDGYGTVVEENCLPAGELPIDGGPLTVTTPAH